MEPTIDRLVPSVSLRLDLQEAQDVINGLEALIEELDEDVAARKEVEATYLRILQQLYDQGVGSTQDDSLQKTPST